jgi:hypothetical protein
VCCLACVVLAGLTFYKPKMDALFDLAAYIERAHGKRPCAEPVTNKPLCCMFVVRAWEYRCGDGGEGGDVECAMLRDKIRRLDCVTTKAAGGES